MLKNNVLGAIREWRVGEMILDGAWEVWMYEDLWEGLGKNMVKLLGLIPIGKQFLHRRIYFPATTTVNRGAEVRLDVRPFARGTRRHKTDEGDGWRLRRHRGV
jgi:hypothetical protein